MTMPEPKNMATVRLCSSLSLSCILVGISLVVLASNATASTAFGFSNETDKEALLAIKDQINGDPFNVLVSWNHSTHFCDWQGVICDLRYQRVSTLNLSSLQLVGSLSPEIGNLSFLRAIYLQNNSLHGTIPNEIGRMVRLKRLLLYRNSFQGDFPINLTRCPALRVIDLSENNLTGKIPTQLGSLPRLTELYLSKNQFSGAIPASLGNISTLQALYMRSNNLEGSIPLELGNLSNLEDLQLGLNNLSGVVPNGLYNISSISFLALASNQFYGSLPQDLGLTLPNLQTFLFGENKFSGPFPPSIANASKLVHFEISQNTFTGHVPMNLGSLHDLEVLSLGSNRLGLGESNGLSFLNSLPNCTNLRYLGFSVNRFTGSLPSSIANLSTKLTSLGMDKNSISGSIPREIGKLVNLEYLAFSENMLSGGIPKSIGKLFKMQELFLYENNLSGKIPSSIGNMSEIIYLGLELNMLEGSIPVSLGKCQKLEQLTLAFNYLTGTIPIQIFSLSSFSRGLYLNDNNLTGPLPSEVGNLKNIELLDISRNKLSGEIPSTLGDCLVLDSLGMNDNLFKGAIPSSFMTLQGIRVLDLSHNNLSGQIPKFLANFRFVQNLNLSYNMFEGEVPDEGLFGNDSAFSIVGNNNLCGGIQELQLPACPRKASEKNKKSSARKVIIAVSSVTLSIFLLLACLCAILYCTRRSRVKLSSASPLDIQFPTLSYAELLQATDGFSSANLLGCGRFGSVYKGILNSGEQIVAVKVLNLQEHKANHTFLVECEALRNTRHRNLVKIITSCSSLDFKGDDFKALVFEFMSKGSLESWLHPTLSEQQDPNSFVQLNFVQRLDIAIDVASALEYLHHQCGSSVIHCDLKPSNVLLDDELCAHVGDFGLARFLAPPDGAPDHSHASSSIGVRGTVGYVAPEYGMGMEASTEGDIYSYGIILLEMFTGKNPTDGIFTDGFSLHYHVKMALPDRVMEIVDSQLMLEEENASERTRRFVTERTKVCLASVLGIGVMCSMEQPRERMGIRDVLMELHRIRKSYLRNGRE